MAYTEVKEKKYYYRVMTVRKGTKFKKRRIYLGKNLSKKELLLKESDADKEFNLIIKDKKNKYIEKIKPKIVEVLRKNKIKKAGIFGSYAHGNARKNSDIDIIIEPAKGMGFKFTGLEIELSRKLKRKVDLVSYDGLSPYLKSRILSQEIRII